MALGAVDHLEQSKDWVLKKDLGAMKVYAHRTQGDLLLSVEMRAPGESEEEKLLTQNDVQKYTEAKSRQLKAVGVGDWKPLSIETRKDAQWREYLVGGVFGRENADTGFLEWHLAGKQRVYQVLFSSAAEVDPKSTAVVQAIDLLKQ